jgi:hypothetical protein
MPKTKHLSRSGRDYDVTAACGATDIEDGQLSAFVSQVTCDDCLKAIDVVPGPQFDSEPEPKPSVMHSEKNCLILVDGVFLTFDHDTRVSALRNMHHTLGQYIEARERNEK